VTAVTGGCLCGSVRYTVIAPPKSVSLCHCRSCRKQSGSNRSMNWLVPVDDLVITGELSTHQDIGDSGRPVLRQFCGRCGSPIRTLADVLPGLAVLKAGTLDETPSTPPNYALYGIRAASWETEGLGCPAYERMPPPPASSGSM
jgi:hypothetical protein